MTLSARRHGDRPRKNRRAAAWFSKVLVGKRGNVYLFIWSLFGGDSMQLLGQAVLVGLVARSLLMF